MTAHTESDPTPERPWQPVSSAGIRRLTLQATEAAIRAAKDKRKKDAEGQS